MAFITFGCGKSLTSEQTEVYYAMLGDLPLAALQLAAQRALLQPLYSAFPTIEMLRRLAVDSVAGPDTRMTSGEAWGLALKAAGACDIEVPGSVDRAFANVPEVVRVAVQRFGFRALYDLPRHSVETARAQFIKIYESLVVQERERMLLTPGMRRELSVMDDETKQVLPMKPEVTNVLKEIGVEYK